MNELMWDWGRVSEALVDFLRTETKKAGLAKGVIGISGGVDSAVSAALATRALGPQNVCALYMPYKTSALSSYEHAKDLSEKLELSLAVEEITPQIDSYFDRHPDASRLRRGNKMARERMTILYDHSAKAGGLVIGTSNRTEILLGYGTLFGDVACALNPLGQLYKTQVWALAEHLAVPEEIVAKPPTADLWEGQTDEEELNLSYREADRLLYFMEDLKEGDAELTGRGFKRDFILHVRSLVEKNRFKSSPTTIADLSAFKKEGR